MNAVAGVPIPALVASGQFHSVPVIQAGAHWVTDLASLTSILDAGVNTGLGVQETDLLDWFGASVERMALHAFGTHGILPTLVARELTVGAFRSDFAWIRVTKNGAPTVCLVEFEAAVKNTLFHQGTRKTPYMGKGFLGGFSQLVDWCVFGQREAGANPVISSALGKNRRRPRFQFCLVAGHEGFAPDALSEERLVWWDEHVKLGYGTKTMTFSAFCNEALETVKNAMRLFR